MKVFEQYEVPTAWEEITIKRQLAVESLSKEYPDLLPLCIVSGYAGIPFDEVRKMPISKIKNILDALTFISTPLPNEPISEFLYKDETYSVVDLIETGSTRLFNPHIC